MTITSTDMADSLMSMDTLREKLAPGDSLNALQMYLDGSDKINFELPLGWNVGLKEAPGTQMTAATMTYGGKTRTMTKDALLAITTMVGIRREYVAKTPGPMIANHLNYWTQHTDKKVKALFDQKDGILAITKPGITPFSNLQLLEQMLDGIEEQYGIGEDSVLADYKFTHDLRRTSFRLIVPEKVRTLQSARSGGVEDNWSVGVQVMNSLVGEVPTSVQGYLFAWWCTNGSISTHASSGKYNRRTQGQDENEVYAWAKASVDDILGGLEHELDAVEDLTTAPMENDATQVLTDIFTEYRVPMKARESIMGALVDSDDLTMYGVMNAVTQAANGEHIDDLAKTALMEIGGDIPRATSGRCDACHRLAVV
jgi:hypothetical protein